MGKVEWGEENSLANLVADLINQKRSHRGFIIDEPAKFVHAPSPLAGEAAAVLRDLQIQY